MRILLAATLALTACSAATGDAPETDRATETSCGARLEMYPVHGPHKGGWGPEVAAGKFTCPVHADNSDYYLGAGDINHPDGHLGNDLFAPRGTPIVVARAGRVAYVANESIGGLNVGITDDCGWTQYYAHLDSIDHSQMIV